MQFRNSLLWFGKAIASGIISLLILSGFTILYSHTGVHRDNPTGATDYIWEPNQLKTTMTEGFSWFRMDGNGFNNITGREDKTDILLMGSSHMEAVQIPKNQNTGCLLNSLLEGSQVYNIGISGHTLYHCIANLDNAMAAYSPKEYVIIETSTVELDIDSMGAVLVNTYPRLKSYDKGLIYMVQKNIPAVKVLYKQLDEWRSSENTASGIRDIAEEPLNNYSGCIYTNLLNDFLSKAAESVDDTGAKLIIFYHPDTAIDASGNLINATDPAALSAFGSACRKNGIIFIDMTDSFQKLYDREHVLAHGFSNTAIGTGHLNASGHKVIAEKISAVIQKERAGKEEGEHVPK